MSYYPVVLIPALWLAIGVVPLAGQEDAVGRQPQQPLLGKLGERAQWTMRFSYEFGEGWERSNKWEEQGEAPEESMLSVVEVAKDAQQQICKMVSRWTGGERVEEWIVAGQHVGERQNGEGYYLVGGENLDSKQLAEADFPELGWLEMAHYRGMANYRGRPVFLFSVPFNNRRLSGDQQMLLAQARRENPKVTAADLFSPKVKEIVVYLDAVTQLPLLYNDGTTIRRYAYKDAPSEPLQAPAAVLAFLTQRDKALRVRLTPPPGPGSP